MDLENFAASQKPTEAAAAKERLKAGGVAVFLMATYGEGDPTDNAVEFMKWLKEAEHAPDMFRALKFTVFGLGNRWVVLCGAGGGGADAGRRRRWNVNGRLQC